MIEDLKLSFTKNGKTYQYIFGTYYKVINTKGEEKYCKVSKSITNILNLKKELIASCTSLIKKSRKA